MNKYAVLIGNSLFLDEPKLSPLRCPENDVKGMQDILEDSDFGCFNTVVPLVNKSLNEVTSGIHDVLNKANKQDLVVIYYSGHGTLSKKTGSLYLATYETKIETLSGSALAISQIQTYISESDCNKVVLILDCCYSGAAIIKGDIESILHSNSRGFYTITASTEFQPAIETEDEEYSLFTKYLINGIKTGEADYDKDGKISVIDLYNYAHVEVLFDNPKQIPTQSVIGQRGELIISKSGCVSIKGEPKEANDLVKPTSYPIVNKKIEILKVIQEEASYRPVAPFLAEGISISAGFPTTKFIVQYLAKVNFAIKYGVFKNRFPKLEDVDNPNLEVYLRHPSKYLEDFGWPVLGQLNADIWDWLERPVEGEKLGQKKNLEVSRKELESRSKNHFMDLLAYDIASEKIIGDTYPLPLKPRDYQQAIVQWVLRKEFAGYDNGTSHMVLREWIRWKEHYYNDNEREPKPVLLHGDWEMLLDNLCEGNLTLTDALFTSFEKGLNPALPHRYQASFMEYSSIPNRPLIKDLKRFPENTKDEKEKKRRPVQLCIAEIKKGNRSSSWSSLAGMSFINSLDNDYTVIWLDFENHHTIEGIIAKFFKLVHKVDSQAPFCTITNMDSEFNKVIISKAVERIRDVFKRGRYVLVLDLVESFGKPKMVHHGIISSDDEHYIKRLEHLKYFLNELLDIDNTKKPYWDSYVVVTAGMPILRHLSDNNSITENLLPASYNKMFDLLSTISDKSKKHDHIHIFSQTPNSKYSDIIANNNFIPKTNLPNNLLEHWFQREGKVSNEEAKKRSLSRTENTFHFLETLRDCENTKVKVKNLSTKEAINTFICVLSVFRHPRSLPLLRSFIERWGLRQIGTKISENKDADSTWNPLSKTDSFNTHCAIRKLLELIVTNVPDEDGNQNPLGVVSQNHEGGVIWLFREAYEATYDALTENIHRKPWVTILEKDFNESRSLYSAGIMDGCLNIIWHLFAARSYYADIFLATHDIKAFLEYLYHRVSAIKVITLLITIIEQAVKEVDDKGENVLWNDLKAHCKELPNDYKNIHKQKIKAPFVWTILALGIFDPIKQDIEKNLDGLTDINELLSYFRILRQNSLSTLLMALNKNEFFLRIEASPNTVLAWSNQFLYSELDYMEQIDEKFPIDTDDPAITTLKELRKQFIRLKYQTLRSKMDYKGALELSTDTDIGSIEKIEAQVLETIKKLATLISQFYINQSLDLDKNNDITKREEFKNLETFFNIAFCLVESRNENADKITHIICEKLSEIKTKEPIIGKWLNKQLQTGYELHCRAKFKSTFWQPLLDRQEISPDNKELESAECYSILYENLIREITEINNNDAKRRSTALTIRARSLFLRGYFAQAHHFLDLSTVGLFAEHIDHWAFLGITNVVRAELLAISANQQYFSLSNEYDQVLVKLEMKNSINKLEKLPDSYDTFINFRKIVRPIATSSLKKIKKAEHELAQAEKLFQNIAHQNIWLIHMEFGWAQIQIEKLLFEIELLFLSWSSLNVREYIKKCGELEQAILDTMKRIRNVFDLIPYQSLQWSNIKTEWKNEVEAGPSMINLERNTLKLWRQLYVVGFYYSRLLGYLYKKKDTSQTELIKIIDFEKKILNYSSEHHL